MDRDVVRTHSTVTESIASLTVSSKTSTEPGVQVLVLGSVTRYSAARTIVGAATLIDGVIVVAKGWVCEDGPGGYY